MRWPILPGVMTVACFCGCVFQTTRSTVCPRCGEPILMREPRESPAEFEERMASHLRMEDEIHALPDVDPSGSEPAITRGPGCSVSGQWVLP